MRASKTPIASQTSPSVLPPRIKRKPGQRLTPQRRVAIQAKSLVGVSNAQISRELQVSQNTVAKVLNESEITELREAGRGRVAGMIPKSLDVFQYRLDRNDANVATQVLKGTGVLAPDAQVNVGIFSMTGNADIAGLMGLAEDSQANRAPIEGGPGAIDAECEPVPGADETPKPDK